MSAVRDVDRLKGCVVHQIREEECLNCGKPCEPECVCPEEGETEESGEETP